MSANPSKRVLLIGVGSPLGSAAARALAGGGRNLALCDWAAEKAEALAEELDAQAYSADPSKKLTLQTMLEEVLAAEPRIDLLVNALVVQPKRPLLDLDEWDWRRTLDFNLTAAFLAMQSVGRVMRQQGGGRIVNLLNAADGGSPAYQAAAAGLQGLSRAAQKELGEYNIQVQAVEVDDLNTLSAEEILG